MASIQTNRHASTKLMVEKIAAVLAQHPGIPRGQLVKLLSSGDEEVKAQNVYRWLDAAIEAGMVNRAGNTSAAVYWPSHKSRLKYIKDFLDSPFEKRERVGYNMSWLEDYEPNKSLLLTQADLAKLHERCPPGTLPMNRASPKEIDLFIAELSYASSRLEGNRADLADTISFGDAIESATNLTPQERQMLLNHRMGAKLLIDRACRPNPISLEPLVIQELHVLLSNQLLRNPDLEGVLRTNQQISVHGSAYMPLSTPGHISTAFELILQKAREIKDPFEASFFLLVHLPYLQPFIDCNKRTSRLVCSIPLLNAGIIPITWIDASFRQEEYQLGALAVYELNDPMVLRELYVQNVMRSAERFEILRRERDPDPVGVIHRLAIKAAIRNIVCDGASMDEISFAGVPASDLAAVANYTQDAVALLKRNPMTGVKYQLSPFDVRDWAARQAEADGEAETTRPRERP